nr:ADP-ribosylation factor GTPase-activating protein AGD4-like isoform X2 [Ipomoea batatas]
METCRAENEVENSNRDRTNELIVKAEALSSYTNTQPLPCHNMCLCLSRGARASIKDAGGFSILERTMETGAIKDEELFVLLAESD